MSGQDTKPEGLEFLDHGRNRARCAGVCRAQGGRVLSETAALGARLFPRLRFGLVSVSAASRETSAGQNGTDFCFARSEFRCASARHWPRGGSVARGPMREFLVGGEAMFVRDFSRFAAGRCAKNNDISNLRYSRATTCAVETPQKSTPPKSKMLKFSRPERWRPPSFVAHRAPQKSHDPASFVGKSRPQRARRQNSVFFQRPKLQTAPQMWNFRLQISTAETQRRGGRRMMNTKLATCATPTGLRTARLIANR